MSEIQETPSGVVVDIDQLRALAMAATPGPWGIDDATPGEIAPFKTDEYGDPELDWSREVAASVTTRADGEFIAAANPAAILYLLGLLEERAR